MTRFFGTRSGWIIGANFSNRAALAKSNIHLPHQAGISYSESEGADSIVLSGGYADDEDHGDVIIYTGMGGRDPKTGKQVADQEFDRGNKALGINKNERLPVRVSRGAMHASAFSPISGYTYSGLYDVDDYWHEIGRDGFRVWRFRLLKVILSDVLDASHLMSAENNTKITERQTVIIQRLIRDIQTAKKVKTLHRYKCQVCGIAISTPAGPYAEAAHIRPLGQPHNGPDIIENILCLCPNHHVLFDSGAFGIADDHSLIGAVGKLKIVRDHKIGAAYLEYHRAHYGLI